MKICLAVCEYNPFHNGHALHLRSMKELTGADYVAVIMSGNFTQRGEIAVCDKFTRARHAVEAGADAVFELPTVFATANAEIFAKGAVKLLGALPGEKTLFFGAESGTKEDFTVAAKILSDESKEFKKLLKTQLKDGISLAKAKMNALSEMQTDMDVELLKSPNNILGIEYTRAIFEGGFDIDIYPFPRQGAGYNDLKIYKDLSSASAIRQAINDGKKKKIKKNVPPFVYGDLPDKLPSADDLTFYSVIMNDKKTLAEISDCTEGLENRLKSAAKDSYNLTELKEKVATKRYTNTRINRILTSSLLGISEKFIDKCMRSDLYLNVLAVKDDSVKLLSEIKQNCKIPLISRKNDVESLKGTALECFEKDVLANDIYNFAAGIKTNEYMMLKV
ncbi:MAG: nucleotidyltransferase family protein [Christensenellaceae bacterium]|nr:nucleotidyltransferase family protein [Christensenellaceae bacterium]MDD6926777.1 nucleotidyltransferase family protein [bacterium]MDY2851014.1 nucleotidyltransferase family protein [Christensenellaceae bacterium]